MRNVLVIDDQPAVREAFRVLFDLHDLPCVTAASADEALACLARGDVGVAIQDMNFSPGRTDGSEGAALFGRLREVDPELPVLLITAWTSLEMAVQLVKEGAADYLAKPWDDAKLVETVHGLLVARRASYRNRGGTAEGQEDAEDNLTTLPDDLIVESPAMARAVELARNVGPSAVPVLVTGPNGSGKERIADLVHAASPRREKPFIKVNVGALPDELMEAELFGAAAGAYTGRDDLRVGRFEAADGGTLFLDEIDSLSLPGQVKLLRALEKGEYSRLGESATRVADVRVVSATNADLQQAIADGRFREDLYFRINVVEVRVPPLAERPEDVLALARSFLERFAAERGAAPHDLSPDAVEALLAHAWPGNVRELRNRIQRADLLAAGQVLQPRDLELGGAASLTSSEIATGQPPSPKLGADELVERQRVERALLDADGIVAHAASALGISRQALYRKMERLGVVLERRPSGR